MFSFIRVVVGTVSFHSIEQDASVHIFCESLTTIKLITQPYSLSLSLIKTLSSSDFKQALPLAIVTSLGASVQSTHFLTGSFPTLTNISLVLCKPLLCMEFSAQYSVKLTAERSFPRLGHVCCFNSFYSNPAYRIQKPILPGSAQGQ